jgi:hypothetical protein
MPRCGDGIEIPGALSRCLGQSFILTIDNGTDDLMDLAWKGSVGRGIAGGESLEAGVKSWAESSARCCCHRWADSLQ